MHLFICQYYVVLLQHSAVWFEIRMAMPPEMFLLFRIVLFILGLPYFHMNLEIILFFNFLFELESCCVTQADFDLVVLWHPTLWVLRLCAHTTMPDSSNEVFLKDLHTLVTLPSVSFTGASSFTCPITISQDFWCWYPLIYTALPSPQYGKPACIKTLLTLLREGSLSHLKPYESSTMILNVVLASLHPCVPWA